MGIQAIIDTHYIPHGNHQGLSVGWLAVIFLAYILTETNHKMCPVQEWVDKHHCESWDCWAYHRTSTIV